MTSRKGSSRRGFFARLVGLTALPFVAKVAAALSAEGPRALGDTDTSIIDEAAATALARAYVKGLARVKLYVPHECVYDHHPLPDYYFFWIDRGELDVGGAETIAVRKSDGRVTHCGLVGE